LSLASLAFALVAATRVLYLDFSDGTEAFLLGDDDDATTNRSAIGAKTAYPAFAPTLAPEAREELTRRVIAGVHRAFLPYDVQLARARPPAGPYTTVVIGGGPSALGFESTVGGVAVLDCANANESNIVFVFPEALRFSPHGMIATIAQEAAHSYGLEHSTNATDFMYPRISATQDRFPDVVATIAGPPMCGQMDQNSHAKLVEVLGPWAGGEKPLLDGTVVDLDAPTLRFVAPAVGDQVSLPFTVTLDAVDEGGIARIEVGAGTAKATLRAAPFRWTIDQAPVGPLVVAATAHDAWGNQVGATLSVEVVEPPPEGGCAAGGAPRRGAPWGPLLVLAAALGACRRARRRL
jgi:hypothetical protein